MKRQESTYNYVVEISTPYSTGTGFYLASHNLIVTDAHVVHENYEVIIEGSTFEKQVTQVVFLDESADLAFLVPPRDHDMISVEVRSTALHPGMEVTAVGHPFGLLTSQTSGVLSKLDVLENNVKYYLHDAALNVGNSGGPLLDENGFWLGLNSFVTDGRSLGLALPASYILQCADVFDMNGGSGAKCGGCQRIVYDLQSRQYCEQCGTKVTFASQFLPFQQIGVPKMIEDIIIKLGYDVRLTREGKNHWNIRRGSALIRLCYHRDTGLIDSDAYLCQIPKEGLDKIYAFMLRENMLTDGLVFNVVGRYAVLSLLIFDRHLDLKTGKRLLEHLFDRADHYDDLLIDRFNASWIEVLSI